MSYISTSLIMIIVSKENGEFIFKNIFFPHLLFFAYLTKMDTYCFCKTGKIKSYVNLKRDQDWMILNLKG